MALAVGELATTSRLGERLHAEVALRLGEGENLDPSCIRLVPSADDPDLPGVSRANISISGRGAATRIVISGLERLRDPALAVGLRIDCGYHLTRSYTVLPEAPSMADTAPAVVLPTASAGQAAERADASPPSPADAFADRMVATAPDRRARRAKTQQIHAARGGAASATARRQHKGGSTGGDRLMVTADEPQWPPAAPRRAYLVPVSLHHMNVDGLGPVGGQPADGDDSGGAAVDAEWNGRLARLQDRIARLTHETQALRMQLEQAGREAARPAPPVRAARPSAALEWLIFAAFALPCVAAFVWLLQRWRGQYAARAQAIELAAWSRALGAAHPAAAPQAAAVTAQRRANEAHDLRGDFPSRLPVSEAKMLDDLQSAEVLMAFGRQAEAARLLIRQIEHAPRQFVHHWLKLLEILRGSNNTAEYGKWAQKFRAHFNVAAAPLPPAAHSHGMSLEDYPHVIAALQARWGTPDALDMLTRLAEDNRNGTRSGFPLPVFEEIILLQGVLRDAWAVDMEASAVC